MSGMLTRAAARAFSTKALHVVNNVATQQFTVSLNNDSAVLSYQQEGKHITFNHTDVPPVFQGKGVGKLLAQYAFDHAHSNKLDVTCKCHFLAKYYENNFSKYEGLNVKIQLD